LTDSPAASQTPAPSQQIPSQPSSSDHGCLIVHGVC
jgi:hypothetical protein